MNSLFPLHSCCFTGHRRISAAARAQLEAQLTDAVSALIAQGVRRFYAGGALGFDTLAARAVIHLRQNYPDIELILALPCKDQTRGWGDWDVAVYEGIKRAANEVVYLSDTYTKTCMLDRNRYMVEHSDCCLCYLTRASGGTAYTVRYAEKRGLAIKNLAE